MFRRRAALAVLSATCAVAAAPAAAQADSVTATGVGHARMLPKNRHSVGGHQTRPPLLGAEVCLRSVTYDASANSGS
jgi:hypothetical protein